jgi:hypothetical protein
VRERLALGIPSRGERGIAPARQVRCDRGELPRVVVMGIRSHSHQPLETMQIMIMIRLLDIER